MVQHWKLPQQREQYLHSAVAEPRDVSFAGQLYFLLSQGISTSHLLIHPQGGERRGGLPAGQASSHC